MNTTNEQQKCISDKVWRWLDEVVIGQNFCPFAKLPRQSGKINLRIFDEQSLVSLAESVLQECIALDNNSNIETTLIVCANYLSDFNEYLDALDLLQQTLDAQAYEGVYQLASFHPHYLFGGEDKNACSHFTNRAPYPIFHIIRENSITQALSQFKNPDNIPQRNIEHANALGAAFFKRFL